MSDYTFIKSKYAYDYPRAANVTDAVVFRFDGEQLYLLLVERKNEPYAGSWALPGGFMEMDETTNQCCRRELLEETGVVATYLKQVGTFADVSRDPRGRVLSTAYYVLVKPDTQIKAGDDVAKAVWMPLREVQQNIAATSRNNDEGFVSVRKKDEVQSFLAFDHATILAVTLQRVREDIHFRPLALQLLPEEFTFPQLCRLYEQILNRKFHHRNLLTKLLKLNILVPTGRKEVCHTHRCGNLYTFSEEAYISYKKNNPSWMEF